MNFIEQSIPGVFIIDLLKREDERGFLARSWDQKAFQQQGFDFEPVEGYTCFTKKTGTVRGLHYIIPPHQEIKVTRVTRGSLFEVVVDLRPESSTYTQWMGTTMHDDEHRMLVTPPGCAHAILTLEDNTEYTSLYSPAYDLDHERGIRYNDPLFNITWPIPVTHVSSKDKSWPDFNTLEPLI